ncbi:MAG: lamin tail domain-containing protein [Candidatus Saccharimonadales bacterium]
MTFKLLFITIFVASLLPVKLALAAAPTLIITEVQTGLYDHTAGDQPQAEFLELTNASSNTLTLDDNWHLDYLSAANNGSTAPTSSLVGLAGSVPAGGHILASFNGYLPDLADLTFGSGSNQTTGLLAKTGGHVRLMDDQVMVDCLSWGSAVAIDGCQKLPGTAPDGASIQRALNDDQQYGEAMYKVPPSPEGRDGFMAATDLDATAGTGGCTDIQIDELMANPSGDDTGREFIEVNNPTQQKISLQGCGLQVGTKSYNFAEDDYLAAGQFKAFYSSQTGLVLTNGGGSVQLLGSAQTAVVYPELADDQVWVQVDGNWQVSNQPTPNDVNLANDAAVDALTGTKLVDLTPCPAGKDRNPQTGRCKNITVAPAAKPCTADQVRNAQSGRCKKAAAANSSQKVCAVGQERNLDTQRCRKVVVKTPKIKTQDDSAASKTKPSYLIMLAVGSIIIIYGIYEYRRDLTYWTRQLKERLFGGQANQ